MLKKVHKLKIKKINLINFRSWEERSFDFLENVLIYGPNASGKTNILEAIYMAATTRPFRGRETNLIKKDKNFLRVGVVFEKDLEVDIEIVFKNSEVLLKEFKIMGRRRPTIDFVGEFSAIIFSPEDINLINGTPADKRKYLSFTIGQKDRGYLYDLLNYKKILKQRNELLKKGDLVIIKEEIEIWDHSLSEYGQKIVEKRKELESFINERIGDYYNKLSMEKLGVNFKYLPSIGEGFQESLAECRKKDIMERTTTVGPHRDNWEILLDEKPATHFASRGEYRTLILALKLCERDYFLYRDGILPVVLLDDVFSELDEKRRRFLIEAFKGSQIIITTNDLDHLEEPLRSDFQLISIDGLQPELDFNK